MKNIPIMAVLLLTCHAVQSEPYGNNNNSQNTSGFKPNAYGAGVGRDQFGRAVKHDLMLKLNKDAYGVGISSDQYGRPVKTDIFGTPVK